MYKEKLDRFYKIISRFKDSKVLVIGDIMLDKFVWGTVSRISPEAPVPVVLTNQESFMPGGAANVANNIRAFGAEVYMCGVIGDDEAGRVLALELARSGLNDEGIIIDKGRPTTNKTRIIAHHQQVVRIDKESDKPLDENIITEVLSVAKKRIPDVDGIIIEDYGKGLIVPSLIKEMIRFSRTHKKIVMVDPKQEHFNLYKHVSAITPNRKEAEEASGIRIKDQDTLRQAGEKLLKRLHSEAVLITLGEDGMALFQRESGYLHIPTVALEVYDVSGAGDTAIAVFCLAISAGANMAEAAYISNAAAGVVVGKLGIAVCSMQELKSHLAQLNKEGIKLRKSSYPSESIFGEPAYKN